jgi:hypothetical protein
LPAIGVLQDGGRGQIHLSPEETRQFFLQAHHVEQARLRALLEFDEQVHVARFRQVAAGGRPEYAQALHAMAPAYGCQPALRHVEGPSLPDNRIRYARLARCQSLDTRCSVHGFRYDRRHLIENRRLAVRLIVLLVAHARHGEQPGGDEPFELPLHGADAGPDVTHDLVRVKASIGIAEQQPKYPALGLREQGLGQPFLHHSHNEYDTSQNGFMSTDLVQCSSVSAGLERRLEMGISRRRSTRNC